MLQNLKKKLINAYKNLAGKPDVKRPLGIQKDKMQDNNEVGRENVNIIQLFLDKAQRRTSAIT